MLQGRGVATAGLFVGYSCEFCGYGGIMKQHNGTLLVAQLVEALRHKSEGHTFDPRWCHCNFSLT
jgi:hypothetical protein